MFPDALGAVLAGGRSRRFGSDKAEALLGGVALIDHAIASLRAIVGEVVVCGRERAGVTGLADCPAGGQGPLAGLNAALHHAARNGRAGVLSLGCDMPFLSAEAARALIGEGAAVLDGQHLVGWWPSGLAARLDAYLARTADRSVRGWLAEVGPRRAAAPGGLPANVNTMADLAALKQAWRAETR